jgi:hypothetical protein
MIGGLFGKRDPRQLVPPAYRPKAAGRRQLTEAEREAMLQMGVAALGRMLGG